MRWRKTLSDLYLPDQEIVRPGVCDILMANNLVGFGAGGTYEKLIDVLTSLSLTTDLKQCLDAGDAASYTSGQSWLDLSGNGYDMFLGSDGSAGGDDPTFNGNAGGLSSAEYFSADGGDIFVYDSALETWMKNLHKNNAIWSVCAWIYRPSSAAASLPLLATTTSLATGIGVGFDITGSDLLEFYVIAGHTPVELNEQSDDAIALDQWTFVAGTLDEPTGAGGGFLYENGAYKQVGASNTFDATYPGPSASDPNGYEFWNWTNNTAIAESGTRMAAIAVWEGGALTKANFDSIFNRTRGRFGI